MLFYGLNSKLAVFCTITKLSDDFWVHIFAFDFEEFYSILQFLPVFFPLVGSGVVWPNAINWTLNNHPHMILLRTR